MKFAHLADCHIGGWKEPELKKLGIKAFEEAINKCIQKNTAFILISGDLFNSALPSIDLLRETAAILRKAKDHDISIYMLPGSHDFSPSGKTMLEVLEKSGLLEIVGKFNRNGKLQFIEDKTGVKISGLLGKKGGLEIKDYEELEKAHLESEQGFKIWMFHTALTEFKPKGMEKMDSLPKAFLPKNFNYYAGGHVHYIFQKKEENSLLTFPGALFPNNFKELEEFNYGGFYIIDDKLNFEYIPVKIKDVKTYYFNAENRTPENVREEIQQRIKDYKDKIITIRVKGRLQSGKPSDIGFKDIIANLGEAYFVLKNTSKLTSKEFEEIEIKSGNVEEIEQKLIEEHSGQMEYIDTKNEQQLIEALMNALNKEKGEGEKNADFEQRVIKDSINILGIEI